MELLIATSTLALVTGILDKGLEDIGVSIFMGFILALVVYPFVSYILEVLR